MHGKTLSISGNTGIGTGLILLTLVLVATSYAQSDTVWTFRYGGTSGTNYQPLASFVDASSATGYVYVAGWAEQPTGGIDALLFKITADSGRLVWEKTYPSMMASGAAMDTSGNVYIAGITHGTTAAGKICILKYLPSGDTDWTRTYGEQGLSFTSVGNIVLDSAQNVYACGRSDSAVRIVKYLPNGMLAPVVSYSPSSPMPLWGGQQFHILRNGGVYLTLVCEHPLGNGRLHWLIVKLSGQGQVQWEKVYRDTGSSYEWAAWSQVDELANIYITGDVVSSVYGTEVYCTAKMDSLGDTLWTREYIGTEGLRSEPRFLMLDKGSVYVAGWSIHHEMGANQAIALVKYDSLGTQQWASRFASQGDSDADVGYHYEIGGNPNFFSMSADDSGNVYLTGDCVSPSPDVPAIFLKYDSQGNLDWVRQLGAPDEAWAGAVVYTDWTGALYGVGKRAFDDAKVSIFVVKYLGR